MKIVYLIQVITLALVLYSLFAPLIFAFLLWVIYDRRIRNIHTELVDTPAKIHENYRGRGVTSAGIEPHIRAAERPLQIRLTKLEYNRKLFLDFANLVLLFKVVK